mgnify:CR=1 FL=1
MFEPGKEQVPVTRLQSACNIQTAASTASPDYGDRRKWHDYNHLQRSVRHRAALEQQDLSGESGTGKRPQSWESVPADPEKPAIASQE